ncbi:hypothetical protein SmJEL517_g00183 [Synchytrium microbalum]|uniref:Cyclin-like domain-containing protein n=1 Tax=Synchytrium microbalum TaxID=1806994 RepID=A0A507CK45_9FUNG|nr:uncharacterized protein SmJEL517_g00183 [Synchytrium microbalum]TPX38173.1 hypothetical protein SmJEL517_g00183 [Synchytrium microbalum]
MDKQLYEQSTQYRHWRRTSSELLQIRQDTHLQAVERVTLLLKDELRHKNSISADELPSPPTSQQIHNVVKFFEHGAHNFSEHFRNLNKETNKNWSDRATAIIFLKRWALYNSLIDHDQKLLPATCLYLALKCENVPIARDEYLLALGKTAPSAEQLLDYEGRILQGIGFELSVRHPFWPLKGFYIKLHEYIQATAPAMLHSSHFGNLSKSYAEAHRLVLASSLTDLYFTHWPAQIALICLRVACKRHFLEDVMQQYMQNIELASLAIEEEERTPEQTLLQQTQKQEALLELMKDAEHQILEVEPLITPSHPKHLDAISALRKVASEANKAIRPYLSPLLDANSYSSKRVKEEAEQERERKRMKKNAGFQLKNEAFSNVFGAIDVEKGAE